jgi:hypothetical protein
MGGRRVPRDAIVAHEWLGGLVQSPSVVCGIILHLEGYIWKDLKTDQPYILHTASFKRTISFLPYFLEGAFVFLLTKDNWPLFW